MLVAGRSRLLTGFLILIGSQGLLMKVPPRLWVMNDFSNRHSPRQGGTFRGRVTLRSDGQSVDRGLVNETGQPGRQRWTAGSYRGNQGPLSSPTWPNAVGYLLDTNHERSSGRCDCQPWGDSPSTPGVTLVGMSRLDRITSDPAICHGQPTVRGLRYTVESLLELLASGMTIDDIVDDYPDLERDDLLAVLEFGALTAGQRRVVPLGAA